MIKLNKKSKKLLLLQRNELLSQKQNWLRRKFGRLIFTNFLVNFYQIKNIEKISEELFKDELKTFQNFLPKNIKNIMDIGCGLGIIDILLDQLYKGDPNFFLLDKNKVDRKIKYGFSSNYESYNDLNETKNLLLNNKISINRINIFDVDKKIEINKNIDLVISLKSMGYHYPIEEYINVIKKCCSDDTIFIFDVSEGYYNENSLNNHFKYIKIIYEERSVHTLKRLFCKGLNNLD